MRWLLIIPLLFCSLVYGQIDNATGKVSKAIAGSRDVARINETITKGNELVDTAAVHLDSLQAIRVDVNVHTDSLAAQAINFVTGTIDVTTLNYTPPHAALNFDDSATVVALTQNIPVKLTGPVGAVFVVQEATGITAAGDTMTIITDGDYEGAIGLSFEGGPSDVFHVSIWVNSVITSWEMQRKTANADTGNMGMPFYLSGLNAGDDVSIRIRNTGDNDDATLVSGQFIMSLHHPD